MTDNQEHGRSPADAGSGYSAKPEPSSTVSAVPVSIPNAMRAITTGISRYINVFLPEPRDYNAFSEKGVARQVLVGIACALDSAASGMEAATAGETVKHGSTEGDSPVPKADAQRDHLNDQ